MTELEDHELLAHYVHTESDSAFSALVERYVNLVYSAALRFTGNSHHAEEISQAVFIILARKAGGLPRDTVLSGWLYQTARFTAANFLKSEIRRQNREQEAYMNSTSNDSEMASWAQIAPLLDHAMGQLNEKDRNAIVLRFFENKTAQEIATVLKLNDAAAYKRTARALDKLRKFFNQNGVTLSVAVLTTAISVNSVQAAPAGLAVTISATAAKGAVVGSSTLTLVKGAMKIMAWTKIKTAVVVGVAILLTAGTATVAVKTIPALRPQPDIQGAWEGIIGTQMGAKLRVVLKVSKANNAYQATLDSVDQRAADIPVSQIVYAAPAFDFEVGAVTGTFKGKLIPGNEEISGTWKQPQLTVPLLLKRTTTPSTIPDLLTERDYTPRAGSDLQGYWKGATQIGQTELPVVFKFSEPSAGQFVAELDSPNQGANNLVVSAVTYRKPTVRVEIGAVGGVFAGELAADGKEIKGSWSQAGQTLPLTIKRTDPRADHAKLTAEAAQINYSYSSPDDLTGHWTGALDVQGMKLHLALHVGKLPNGSLAGSLDSLDQGADGIPANTVSFSAPTAHLEWQTIAGSFDGKIQNGKLSGTWWQGGQSFPLVFVRSQK